MGNKTTERFGRAPQGESGKRSNHSFAGLIIQNVLVSEELSQSCLQRRPFTEITEATAINIFNKVWNIVTRSGILIVLCCAPEYVHHRAWTIGNIRPLNELTE